MLRLRWVMGNQKHQEEPEDWRKRKRHIYELQLNINNLQSIVFMKGMNIFRAMRESSHKDKRSNLPRVENTSSAQIKKKKTKQSHSATICGRISFVHLGSCSLPCRVFFVQRNKAKFICLFKISRSLPSTHPNKIPTLKDRNWWLTLLLTQTPNCTPKCQRDDSCIHCRYT